MEQQTATLLVPYLGFPENAPVTVAWMDDATKITGQQNGQEVTIDLLTDSDRKMFQSQKGILWEPTNKADATPEMAAPPVEQFAVTVPEDVMGKRLELEDLYGDIEITENNFELVKNGWVEVRRTDKVIQSLFKSPKSKAHTLHRGLVDQEKAERGKLPHLDKKLKGQLEAYQAEREAETEQPDDDLTTVPTRPALGGATEFRKERRAEVVDIKALMRAVLRGKLPVELIDINAKALNTLVKAAEIKKPRDLTTKIPGVKIIEASAIRLHNNYKPNGK